MNKRLGFSSVAFASCLCTAISLAQDAVVVPKIPNGPLEEILKKGLLTQLPANLVFEHGDNWGHQARIPSIQGIKPIEVMRNHGNWHRVKAVCQDLPHTMDVYTHHQRVVATDRLAFVLHVTLPITLELEHQTWQNGVEVFSRRGRARLELHAEIAMETRAKWDSKGEIGLAEGCCFKLAEAKISCNNFVPENINGVGGDLGRIVGGKLQGEVSRWQPSLESDAKQKLSSAILKLGTKPETHAKLGKLLGECSIQAAMAPVPLVLFQTAVPQPLVVIPAPVQTYSSSKWFNIDFDLTELVKVSGSSAPLASPRATPVAPAVSSARSAPLAHPDPVPYSAPSYHSSSASTSHSSSASHSTSVDTPRKK